jgi:hypothetical protein
MLKIFVGPVMGGLNPHQPPVNTPLQSMITLIVPAAVDSSEESKIIMMMTWRNKMDFYARPKLKVMNSLVYIFFICRFCAFFYVLIGSRTQLLLCSLIQRITWRNNLMVLRTCTACSSTMYVFRFLCDADVLWHKHKKLCNVLLEFG